MDVYTVVALILLLLGAAYMLRIRGSSREDMLRVEEDGYVPSAPLKVLILTAAVGGGHEAAGRAVRDEVEAAGHRVVMMDGLRPMNPVLDWLLRKGYVGQLEHTPWTLGALFSLASFRPTAWAVRIIVGLFFSRGLLKAVLSEWPDVIVSTYPLVTSALGHLRKKGKLRVPVTAIIPDYGVHPLWVSPGADLHLVVSRISVQMAERAGGEASLIRPPVAPAFRNARGRYEETRTALGLPEKDFVALVVGGAWGIGDVEGAARCAVDSGVYTVIVTGRNAALKARLEAEFKSKERVKILGWTKDMPGIMAASDCLIQNAGGMTCVEAVEVGLPILLFNPIPGHGVLNSRVMDRAGAARLMHTREELVDILQAASRGEIALPAPYKEENAPSISTVLESLVTAPQPVRPQRILRPRPVLVSMFALAFLFWVGFAPPGVALASKGFNLNIPGSNASPGLFAIGVRVTDPDTAAALEGMIEREKLPVTIFADAQGARGLYPAEGVSFGVAEEPESSPFSAPWKDRAQTRAAAAELRQSTGVHPQYFLPALGRANLASLADAPRNTRLVMPERITQGGPAPGLIVIETSGLTTQEAQSQITRTLQEAQRKGLRCVPLSEL